MVKNAPQPEALLAWMDSLADATRLRLLRLLERHELGVVDLCQVLQMPQSTVSRHLKLLSDQGWAASRRQGTTNLYYMRRHELDEPARRLWALARQQTEDWATLHQDELRLTRRLRQRKRDAQAFFAGAAGQWDKLREQLYGRTFMQQALLALLPPQWVVADLGCGTGQAAVELARCVRKVIAVDNSPAMLKAAGKRLVGFDNVELRRGDVESLPIDDGACDAAVMMLVLTYVQNPTAAVHQMARIVRPGGRAVVIDLLCHDRRDFRRQMDQQCMGFEPAEMQSLLTEAGFEDAACRPLPPEPDAKGPALLLATGVKSK